MSLIDTPKVVNYWTWKDSEIIDALKEYSVDMGEEYDRKKAIAELKRQEMIALEGIDLSEKDADKKAAMMEDLAKKAEIPILLLSTVIFHNTSEQDLPYVAVGHNGLAFYIPREVEVDVPDYILDSCIKDAVEDRMYPEVSQNGDINWKVRKVQRFPYTVVKRSFPAPRRRNK